jgi:hypothetical protein
VSERVIVQQNSSDSSSSFSHFLKASSSSSHHRPSDSDRTFDLNNLFASREKKFDSDMMHAIPQHGSLPAVHVGGYPDGASNMTTAGDMVQSENRKHDITEILQQIMNITDQSLDEAQARSVTVSHGLVTTFVFIFFLLMPGPSLPCPRVPGSHLTAVRWFATMCHPMSCVRLTLVPHHH